VSNFIRIVSECFGGGDLEFVDRGRIGYRGEFSDFVGAEVDAAFAEKPAN
jgi:hypothetical protein